MITKTGIAAGCLAVSLMGLIPTGARAQGTWLGGEEAAGAGLGHGIDRYVAMLEELPLALAVPQEGIPALSYADFAAARQVNAGLARPERDALIVAMRVAPLALGYWQSPDQIEAWPQVVGYGMDDVQQALTYTNRPARAALLRLPEAVARGVPSVLRGQGYAETSVEGVSALAVGEDHGFDLSAEARQDPLRGDMGSGARVQIDGGVLRLAPTWPMMGVLGDLTGGSAMDDPHVAAATAVLGTVAQGALLQAVTYVDIGFLAREDPFVALYGFETPDGPTPWRTLSILDFAEGEQSLGVMALTLRWPEDVDLDPLAADIASRWQAEGFDARIAPVEVRAHAVVDGVGVITLAGWQPTDFDQLRVVNPVVEGMQRAVVSGEISFLP